MIWVKELQVTGKHFNLHYYKKKANKMTGEGKKQKLENICKKFMLKINSFKKCVNTVRVWHACVRVVRAACMCGGRVCSACVMHVQRARGMRVLLECVCAACVVYLG